MRNPGTVAAHQAVGSSGVRADERHCVDLVMSSIVK